MRRVVNRPSWNSSPPKKSRPATKPGAITRRSFSFFISGTFTMTSPYRQLRRQGSERARTDRRLRANDSYPDNHFTTFADSSGPGQRDTGSARRYRTYHSRPRRDSAVTGIRVRPHSARRCARPNETRYSPVGTNLLSESQRQPQSRARRDFERLGISIRRARVADAHSVGHRRGGTNIWVVQDYRDFPKPDLLYFGIRNQRFALPLAAGREENSP